VKPENVIFFESAAEFREWLRKNHATADYQWLGFYKKGAARSGVDYEAAVLEALCFGWIDGQLGPMDAERRAVRFTPRRLGSIWSKVNIARMERLIADGQVAPAGMRAYEARTPERSGIYLHEGGKAEFTADLEERFRANPAAWEFWSSTPAGYRRQMTWWVVNAKREETRLRRLEVLIEEHGAGRRLDPVHMPKMSERP
jgi:uncharacterized protein YdeI (YjbR/CyaY-like superfamily)